MPFHQPAGGPSGPTHGEIADAIAVLKQPAAIRARTDGEIVLFRAAVVAAAAGLTDESMLTKTTGRGAEWFPGDSAIAQGYAERDRDLRASLTEARHLLSLTPRAREIEVERMREKAVGCESRILSDGYRARASVLEKKVNAIPEGWGLPVPQPPEPANLAATIEKQYQATLTKVRAHLAQKRSSGR